jgi:DNA-binding IclR family transcriptional regulator
MGINFAGNCRVTMGKAMLAEMVLATVKSLAEALRWRQSEPFRKVSDGVMNKIALHGLFYLSG